MYLRRLAVLCLGALTAVSSAGAGNIGTAPDHAPARVLELVGERVHGRYHNLEQHEASLVADVPDEQRFRPMHQIFVPVRIPDISGTLVFQQSSADGSLEPDRIIRLGILQYFVHPDTGLVHQRELAFRQPERFHNAHLNPDLLEALSLDEFEWDPGCDFPLVFDPVDNVLYGEIEPGACRIYSEGLGKALSADDAVWIHPAEYWFLGRYVDDVGEVMWGNASEDPVRLQRVGTVEELSVPETGSPGPVLVVGATRGTGLEVARLLVGRGERVVALVRPASDRSALEELGVAIVTGDALEPDEVAAIFDRYPIRSVVSTLGCRGCEQPPDYIGNRNLVDAAEAAGVRHMVMISTIGAGDSAAAPPLLARWLLRDVIELKQKAEAHLAESTLGYTIIRPGALRDGPSTGRGRLTEDREAMGVITRADLAELIVSTLYDDNSRNRIYAAVDPDLAWPWDLF